MVAERPEAVKLLAQHRRCHVQLQVEELELEADVPQVPVHERFARRHEEPQLAGAASRRGQCEEDEKIAHATRIDEKKR